MPELTIESKPASAVDGAAAEERVATVTGLRLCIRCGFNLTGQTVLREPKYRLLIARCPECGTVAPLQEYPSLGAWQRRWAVILAGLWFAVVIALGIGTAMLPRLLAGGIALRQAHPVVLHISAAWAPAIKDALKAVHANDGSAAALSPGMLALGQQYAAWYGSGQYTELQIDAWIQQGAIPLDEQWWEDNNAVVLATAPGASWDWLRDEPLDRWTMFALVCILLGAIWSAILLHHHLRGRLLVGGLITVCAALILWSVRPEPFGIWGGGVWGTPQGSARNVAYATIWPETAAISLLVFATALFLGLIFGRPLVRLLARGLLPPRACQAIAPLWFCDGRTPPRVRIDPRRRGRSS